MKFKNESDWKEGLAKNVDPYGAAIYVYAEAWANLMEELMADGQTVEACAKKASDDANTDGITGFMYGAAVSVLAHCWEHGEELRRWHNLDAQIGNEGEKANESGGTLNPGIVNIGL